MKTYLKALIFISIIGAVIPHLGIVFVMIIFFFPILLIPFILLNYGYLKIIEGKENIVLKMKFLKTIALVLAFVFSAIASDRTTEFYYTSRVDALVLKLEAHKTKHLKYPSKLNKIEVGIEEENSSIQYNYNDKKDQYRISFYGCSLVKIEYNSETNKWKRYGRDTI